MTRVYIYIHWYFIFEIYGYMQYTKAVYIFSDFLSPYTIRIFILVNCYKSFMFA